MARLGGKCSILSGLIYIISGVVFFVYQAGRFEWNSIASISAYFQTFEDTIRDVREAKKLWGDRIALLGGIDMDFLCRASAGEVRQRVRDTLDTCMPGGGYCLRTGNSVANYLPMDNYLAMLDEGRNYI
jgi:uroporphyrinogen-III decarboxylase